MLRKVEVARENYPDRDRQTERGGDEAERLHRERQRQTETETDRDREERRVNKILYNACDFNSCSLVYLANE